MSVSKHEIERVKTGKDCREIAGERTKLRGHGELYGPCPKCGGDDRFHVKRDSWMCRQCHPKWDDVIGLVRWLDDIGFVDAMRALGAQVEEAPLPSRFVQGQSDAIDNEVFQWLESERNIRDNIAGLYGAFGTTIGIPGTNGKKHGKALCIPWVDWDGNTTGYKYRFIEDNGISKMTSRGTTSGLLFGILWPANPASTLFVVEGELNAMSIRQVAGANVDVVSVGGESVRPTNKMREYVKQFRKCVVWFDRPDLGEQMVYDLWADAWITPDGYDANEVLCHGDDALKKMIDVAVANLI